MHRLTPDKIKVRTVWISDVHLGYIGCKSDYLLDFLEKVECETLYLVGDIIDVWSLSRSFYWPAEHNQIIRTILKKARDGVRVIYIPGNHDHIFRDYIGESFGAVEIRENHIHETLDGKRLLVIHGDEVDNVIRFSRFTQLIGDTAYDFLLFLNRLANHIRRRFGYSYWSLAGYIKSRLNNAAQAIECFELAILDWATHKQVDGVVCGHIHHPDIRREKGLLYCNDGDWVENCTAMIETRNGELEIWHWSDSCERLKQAHAFNHEQSRAA
ncbi:MAG TPA: UDP-2,3-diacylglucosamine diphosphatase [Pseudomonadales bacterium]|nr:UDP-2,3-diacylglucosamine diphosphatase [Pseudomonadales bacterium]